MEGVPEELNRTVRPREYDALVDYALSLGVEQGFIQEGDTAKESYIPAFTYEGVQE
jgi:putative pyruvate formate lyase activating enzyme